MEAVLPAERVLSAAAECFYSRFPHPGVRGMSATNGNETAAASPASGNSSGAGSGSGAAATNGESNGERKSGAEKSSRHSSSSKNANSSASSSGNRHKSGTTVYEAHQYVGPYRLEKTLGKGQTGKTHDIVFDCFFASSWKSILIE